jgi:eukaryotic-like serine/threonine-protein kinase
MTLAPGTKLGPYEVTALIGAGGMGEVYSATDTRLGRAVAIKILPPEVSADPDRRARFEREARTVGALSHPNIVAIHDVGTVNDVTFLVMELLEGETLRARLDQTRPAQMPGTPTPPPDPTASTIGSGAKRLRGGLPLQKALDIAAQVAQGLAAAHARGIVHRDLKPENIYLTADGRVKVLDFGLARAIAPNLPDAQTRTTPADAGATKPGMVLGTVGYMAPEQVRGRDADHRADIFALGSVLYEMLTGARAFAADSAIETMSAILSVDPLERRDALAGLPAPVEGLVRHCLEKQPDERFQSARDLAFQLQAIGTGLAGSGAVAATALPVARRSSRASLMAAALALVVIGPSLFVVGRWTAPRPAVFDVGLPDDAPIAFAGASVWGSEQQSIAVSPLGDLFVYVAQRGDTTELWVRSLIGAEARPLPGTAGAQFPAMSADGRTAAFVSGRLLKVVAVNGSSDARDVAEVRDPGVLLWIGPKWVLAAGYRWDVASGTRSEERGCESATDLLPDGRTLLCQAESLVHDIPLSRLEKPRTDAPKPLRVTINGDPATPLAGGQARLIEGRLVYVTSAGELAAATFDAATGAVGTAVILERKVRRSVIWGSGHYGVTASGDLVYVPGSNGAIGRFVARRPGGQLDVLPLPAKEYIRFAVSKDDQWIAATVRAATGFELWVHSLSTGRGERVAKGYLIGSPVWTPSGRLEFGVTSSPADRTSVRFATVPGQGRSPERLVGFGDQEVSDYTTGDQFALQSADAGNADIEVRTRDKPPVQLRLPGSQYFPLVSPDRRWIAYTSNENSSPEAWVTSFPNMTERFKISAGEGGEPVWLPKGALVYRVGHAWYRMTPDATRKPPFKEPAFLFSDERLLNTSGLSNVSLSDGSIVYLQTLAPTTGGYVRVVRGWVNKLKAAVPK